MTTFEERTGSSNPFDDILVNVVSNPAFSDIDNDGDLDLVVGEIEDTLNYFENTGNAASPTYVEQTDSNNPFDGIDVEFSSSPILADLDDDGDLDLVVGDYTGTLKYFENAGDATSPSYVKQTDSDNPFDGIDVGSYNKPTLTDLDNDGDLDLVVGNSVGTLNYFENTGDAANPIYVEQTDSNNPFDGIDVGSYITPTLTDIDSDGDLDLVVGEYDGTLNYFENTGDATSPSYVEQTDSDNPFDGINVGTFSKPTFADLDDDGDLDLVVGASGRDGELSYFENTTTTAPIIQQAVADQALDAYEAFSLSLSGVFSDAEDDELTITASGLPDWLNFDTSTQTLTGTPFGNDQDTVTITLTAEDSDGATVSDSFDLTVNFPSNDVASTTTGTSGDDTLTGNSSDQTINGKAGNDIISGKDGDDNLSGGTGDDELSGGSGNDILDGGKGVDILRGNGNKDILFGGDSGDELKGGAGSDTLDGGNGVDILTGGAGTDLLIGGNGQDDLTGGAGADGFVLTPNQGTDTIQDFEDGVDMFVLTGGLEFADLTFSVDAGSTQIRADGNTLAIVTGVTDTSILTAADFTTDFAPITTV